MLTTKSLADGFRVARIASAVLAGLAAITALPAFAQSANDGVPPWQRPPGQGGRIHAAAMERAEYVPQGEAVPDAGEDQPARTPVESRRSVPGPADGGVVEGGLEEHTPWAAADCADCETENCLNPFPNRLWVRGEFLALFGKGATLQPLVTTSPSGTPRAQAGVLDQPNTSILLGEGGTDPGILPGGRFTLGYKCRPCEESGLEISYMFLANKSAVFTATNDTTPVIARPFFNVETNVQDSLIIALPGQQSGSIRVSLADQFNSLEAIWRQSITTASCRPVDVLFGYRYGHFTEILSANSVSTFVSQVGVIPVGTVSVVNDRFAAANDFQGGELGLSTRFRRCQWSLDVTGKFALGNTRSVVTISGDSTIIPPTGSSTRSNGGLLALPTNIGRFEENNLTVIPELGMTLGYDVTPRLRATLGYTFLYWSRVARPGDQLDLNVNPSQLSGGTLTNNASPRFRFVPGDYWVQGVTAGLDYRF